MPLYGKIARFASASCNFACARINCPSCRTLQTAHFSIQSRRELRRTLIIHSSLNQRKGLFPLSTAGIIAEYNPLHTGHLYHLRETKKHADRVVVVLSSNTVQRAGPSFFSKWDRARAAVIAGADVVLELPAVWACAPAERFAFAGVRFLHGTGCVDTLSCGSESGDAAALERAAAAAAEAESSPILARFLKDGLTYAAAREKAASALAGPENALYLRDPNNILAIEYLKANAALPAPMGFMTVKRAGAGHDSDTPIEGFASASMLRAMLGREEQAAQGYIPAEVLPVFAAALQEGRYAPGMAQMDRAILYQLSAMTPVQLRALPDISEGLENRFLSAVKEVGSVEELLQMVKTKRYTMSRLRRVLWCMMMGTTAALQQTAPPYLRVLDFRAGSGQELLREMKRKGNLPIYHSMAKLERDFPEYAAVEKNATTLFNLCCKKVQHISEYPLIRPFLTDTISER